jgi:hypothetical protein
MAHPKFENSVYEFGKLAIGSLITAHGGGLVALFAYLGQKSDQALHFREPFVAMAAGLLLATVSALFAYLNQFFLAFKEERIWLWWVSLISATLSLLALPLAWSFAFFALMQR